MNPSEILLPRFVSVEEYQAWFETVPQDQRGLVLAKAKSRLSRLRAEREHALQVAAAAQAKVEGLEHELAVVEGRPCGCPAPPDLTLVDG